MLSRHTLLRLVASLVFACTLGRTTLGQYGPPVGNVDYDDANANIFLADEITYITVTMDPDDLDSIIDDFRVRASDDYRECSVRIVNSAIDETVTQVGIRARGNLARWAEKFPWKLSFNAFVPGRKFHGLKKVNLGSEHNDPSLTRSDLLHRTFREMGVPAPRTHFVHLTINDGTRVEGVYVHIEQVDTEFVEAWYGDSLGDLYKCRHKGGNGADLRYVPPGTPAAYRDLEDGEMYQEQINDENFIAFANFIDFVNNSDDTTFADEIGDHLNVDSFLRALAVEVVGAHWDGYWYGANNYYLFQNTDAGGRFEYIPWDLDNTTGLDYFGIDWATREFNGWGDGGFGGGSQVPVLARRMIDTPIYRARLLAYAHECAQRIYTLPGNDERLSLIQTILDPYVFQGTFQGNSMDWGYTRDDFRDAFDLPAQYSSQSSPATWGLRPFLDRRQDFMLYEEEQPVPELRVFVNEIVALNNTIITDEAGEYEDYVELYNDETFPVDVGGMYLSDYAGDVTKWMIPLGTVIASKSYLIIWCDDELQGPLHAPFKLTSEGEGVWLFESDAGGQLLVDHLTYPRLGDDEAWGRSPDGSYQVMRLAQPSPGASNNDTGGLSLTFDGDCPGPTDIYVTGATPGGTVAIVAAPSSGSTTIPGGNACAGTVLNIAGPIQIAAIETADGAGVTITFLDVPEYACDIAHVQAIDVVTCNTSNVVVP